MTVVTLLITLCPTVLGLVCGNYQWWMTVGPIVAMFIMEAVAKSPACRNVQFADTATKVVYMMLFFAWLIMSGVSIYFAAVGV